MGLGVFAREIYGRISHGDTEDTEGREEREKRKKQKIKNEPVGDALL
jgi:hypothetical protein